MFRLVYNIYVFLLSLIYTIDTVFNHHHHLYVAGNWESTTQQLQPVLPASLQLQ